MLSKVMTSALRATAALALMAGLSTTAAMAQTAEGYWQGVQKSGTLRCGAAVAPPYVMRDPASGEYSGFFADLCREFAEVLKVKPAFVDTTWDNIVAGLQAGKWDVSLALNRTPARATACVDAPLFGKQNHRSFGGVFDRTCVRPLNVALITPRAGMLFGKLGSHRFREKPALEPRV